MKKITKTLLTILILPWILLSGIVFVFKPRIISSYSEPAYAAKQVCATTAILDIRVPNYIDRSILYRSKFFDSGSIVDDEWHLYGHISWTQQSDADVCN